MNAVSRFVLAALLIGSIIGPFEMSIDPAAQTVQAGETAFFKINVTAAGIPEPVVLETVDGCAVEPPTLLPDDGAVLACNLPVGTHMVIVTGTSEHHTETVMATVIVELWRVWLPIVIAGLAE